MHAHNVACCACTLLLEAPAPGTPFKAGAACRRSCCPPPSQSDTSKKRRCLGGGGAYAEHQLQHVLMFCLVGAACQAETPAPGAQQRLRERPAALQSNLPVIKRAPTALWRHAEVVRNIQAVDNGMRPASRGAGCDCVSSPGSLSCAWCSAAGSAATVHLQRLCQQGSSRDGTKIVE